MTFLWGSVIRLRTQIKIFGENFEQYHLTPFFRVIRDTPHFCIVRSIRTLEYPKFSFIVDRFRTI